MDFDKILAGVKMIIDGVGDDPTRDGLRDTPKRVADTWVKFFQINEKSDDEILCQRFHVHGYSDLVLVKNIQFSSFCEHHILPFFGNVSIAYIPSSESVVGLSKLARIVDKYAKRLQIQERMTQQIHDAIRESTQNDGVFVIVSAEHMCMSVRGIMKPGSKTVTRAFSGKFETDSNLIIEAQQLIFDTK